MNITTFTDYALRVLIYLAVNDSKKATAEDIAKAYDISYHHVAKAAQWLAKKGYVRSERGRAGGISLGRKAEDINIGGLLKESEARTVLVDCARADGGSCCIKPACGLKRALAEAQAAFFAMLEKYSLADVIVQKSALNSLLLRVQ